MFYILGTHNYIFHAKHGNSKLRNVHLKVKKKKVVFFNEVMSHMGLGRMMMIMLIVHKDEDGDKGE